MPATAMPKPGRLKLKSIATRECGREVKLGSGDYIDLKVYEPAMRHLLDTYIRAEESETLSEFDDLTLVELIVRRGEAGIDALPEGIKGSRKATAETIEKQRSSGNY